MDDYGSEGQQDNRSPSVTARTTILYVWVQACVLCAGVQTTFAISL